MPLNKKLLIIIFFISIMKLAYQTPHFLQTDENFTPRRFLQDDILNFQQKDQRCNTVNNFPVFYGGIQNNVVRNLHLSPDQSRIVLCGESYSPDNFVDKPIEAYLLVVQAQDGSYIWGKYYQDRATNATNYVGLFYQCKYMTDQKIVVSGQANFYKAFVGIINATDGTFQQTALFESDDPKYKVGYNSDGMSFDSAGNIINGVYFMNSAITIVKLIPGSFSTRMNRWLPMTMDWKTQLGTDLTSSSSGVQICSDPYDDYAYAGISVQFHDGLQKSAVGAIAQLQVINGNMNWFKRDLSLDGINQLQCMPDRSGIIGCGNRAATSYIFRVRENGEMIFNYMFTGDNPEQCRGLIYQSQTFYVLLETMSSNYTNSGSYDAVVIQFNMNGQIRKGQFMTLQSRLQLGRGLFLMKDGSLIFTGITRRVFSHNYQYNAIFLQRVNIMTGEKTCVDMKNIPDPTAISFRDDQSQFGDCNNGILNSQLTQQPNDYLQLSITFTPALIKAYPLKSEVPYKQFQLCMFGAYDNPYEKIVGNKTIINTKPNPTEISYPTMIYYLGEVDQTKKIDNWMYSYLKNQTNLEIGLSNGQPIPDFIKIKDDLVKIFTNDESNVGNYAIKFTGCYENKIATFFQAVQIRLNTAPILLNMTTLNSTVLNYTVGSGISHLLIPQISDLEQNSEFQLTLTTSPTNLKVTKLPYFMKFDPLSQLLTISPQSPTDVGLYTIYATVQEVDAPSYFSNYMIRIRVDTPPGFVDPYQNNTMLKGRLNSEEMKTEQRLVVEFNRQIEVPPQSYEIIKEQGFINISVSGPLAPYSYTWRIEEITRDQISFFIKFKEASKIGMLDENEMVQIIFNKYLIYTEVEGKNSSEKKQVFLSNLQYSTEIKLIVDKHDQQISSLNSLSVAFKSTLAAVMGAGILSQAIMSNVMQNLWAVIRSLQILSYMAFMHVNLTPELYIVFDMLLASHFDLIPLSDTITAGINKYIHAGEMEEFKPFTENMGIFDYETTLLFVNLTDTWLLFGIIATTYLIFWSLSKITKGFPKLNKYCEEKMKDYKYNAIIRACLEMYLDLTLFSFIGCVKFSFSDVARGFSVAFSLILFPLCIAMIPICFFFVRKKFVGIKPIETEVDDKISSIVEGIHLTKKWALQFSTFFMMRRLYFSLLFSWPRHYFIIQLILNLVHCVGQLGYLLSVRPYQSMKTNGQEIFNEVCILTVACLLFGLTDAGTTTFDTRMRVSWAIIFVIFAQVVANLCLVLYEMSIALRNWWTQRKQNKRAQKYDTGEIIGTTEMADMSRKGTLADSRSKFNMASLGEYVGESAGKNLHGIEEEIKEGEPVYGEGNYVSTEIGRPSNTPLGPNFDDIYSHKASTIDQIKRQKSSDQKRPKHQHLDSIQEMNLSRDDSPPDEDQNNQNVTTTHSQDGQKEQKFIKDPQNDNNPIKIQQPTFRTQEVTESVEKLISEELSNNQPKGQFLGADPNLLKEFEPAPLSRQQTEESKKSSEELKSRVISQRNTPMQSSGQLEMSQLDSKINEKLVGIKQRFGWNKSQGDNLLLEKEEQESQTQIKPIIKKKKTRQ